MRKIIDEWRVAKYAVLILDGSIMDEPEHFNYKIDGEIYTTVPVHDMGDNVIAVESGKSFIGKTVEFIPETI